MGGGDWNDAMNRVGIGGRGESVWLSWFGALVLEKMAAEAEHRGETARRDRWAEFAARLRNAAYEAWDGDWFLRGYYDDGTPLGSHASDACRIDGISQAFSVLADPAPEDPARRARRMQALDSAVERLWVGGPVARLFTPPFTAESARDPGYVKTYPPGMRENGGQYTHGAVWLALALLRAGRTEEGAALLLSLLPSDRGPAYLTEPWYLAADVYDAPGLEGRGGWSIYTGAAGWYLQTALRELLGLRFSGNRLYVSPRLPWAWPGFTVELRSPGRLTLTVRRGENPGLFVDGHPAGFIPLPRAGQETEAELILPEET